MKTSVLSIGFLSVVLVLTVGLPATPASAVEELDAGSVAIGAGLFRSYCASCHGRAAKGDGDIAEYLTVPPSDLTKVAERSGGTFDKKLVEKIIDGREKVKGHGGKDMPVWGAAFQNTGGEMSEEEVARRIGHLANFIQSIQE